jgi:hypothetical protein
VTSGDGYYGKTSRGAALLARDKPILRFSETLESKLDIETRL